MPSDDITYKVGKHEATLDSLQKEVHAMRQDIAEMKTIMAEAKGGWRVLIAVGGVSATIAAAFMKFWDSFIGDPLQ